MTRYISSSRDRVFGYYQQPASIKGWNMRADAVAASGLESDTSKTRTCEAKKDLERGTNSVESNLVAIGFRDS